MPPLMVWRPPDQEMSSTNCIWPTLRPFGNPAVPCPPPLPTPVKPPEFDPPSPNENRSGIRACTLEKSATPKMAEYQLPEPMKLLTRVGEMIQVWFSCPAFWGWVLTELKAGAIGLVPVAWTPRSMLNRAFNFCLSLML